MTTDNRVQELFAVWEEARRSGRPRSVTDVCAATPELAPLVWLAVLAKYGDPDDTKSRLPTDTDEKTTRHTPGPPVPAAVGGYRVLRELGHGGMGCVYEAEDPQLRRRVAVKVMRPELAADPTSRERFLREARAQAAVQHDHVAVIHDVKQDADGTPFLVMPLLRGETLAARLVRQGRPLPVAEVLRVGRQVADGLAAAHAAGLVHRDVKPGNIWLDADDGKVRVLDFGLAKPVDAAADVSASGAVVGTPAYMAPEQASGREVDHRADLFALGAVLFELATGTRAFAGRTSAEVYAAVLAHTPPPAHALNPAVPGPLSDLIAGLLAKEPAARTPDTAAGVAAVLGQLATAGGDTTVTYLPPTPPPRRRRWPLVAGVLGLLAVLVGLLVSPRSCGPTTPPPPTEPTPDPAPAAPLRGSVDLLVHRVDGTGSDVLVPLGHPLAMPLRTGDDFKVVAEVNRPAFLYLFWIDETGTAAPVYPWTPGEWGTRPATETPTAKLDLTAPNGNGFEITGEASGMETILMLARSTELDAGDDAVKGWFAGLKALPFRGEQARVWFEDFDVVREDKLRAVNWAGDPAAPDGPRGMQQAIKAKVGPAEFSRAVSFARTGPNK